MLTKVLEKSIIHGAWIYLVAVYAERAINNTMTIIIGGF